MIFLPEAQASGAFGLRPGEADKLPRAPFGSRIPNSHKRCYANTQSWEPVNRLVIASKMLSFSSNMLESVDDGHHTGVRLDWGRNIINLSWALSGVPSQIWKSAILTNLQISLWCSPVYPYAHELDN